MIDKTNPNIPPILNMADFVLVEKTYEDNYGNIKGKYRLKIALDDLHLAVDDPAYKEYFKVNPPEFYMIKHMENAGLIAEYVGSYFVHYLIDKRAPIVHLVKDEKGKIYTASKFIPNFYGVDDDEVQSNGCLSEGCFIGEDGKIHPIKNKIRENDYDSQLYLPNDKEEVYAAAEFVRYPDPSGQNNGITISDNGTNFAVIDFDCTMTQLSEPLFFVYFQNNDTQKLIAALKSVTNKISKEFIEESLNQLFESITKVISMEDNEVNSQKTQMTNDLINRLEMYKTDIILLEIQEIINSNPINQQKLLDSKLTQLDFLGLASATSKVLLNTVNMVADKHKAIFDKLDGFIKDYSQDPFATILYEANRAIIIHNQYTGEYSEILPSATPYITSKDGFSDINKALDWLLHTKQNQALTYKTLLHLQKFPGVLYEVIDDIFDWPSGDDQYAFNTAFPYLDQAYDGDEYTDKIIDKAIHTNKIFDALVPYFSYEEQCFLDKRSEFIPYQPAESISYW